MRSPRISSAALIVLIALAPAIAGERSESKVKASATAGKIGADGKQTVTSTLEIDKDWYIYANPINANTDVLKPNQTEIVFKTKEKLKAAVTYPKGKKKMDGKYEFDIYEGKIVITAQVQRPAADSGELRISIDVNTCKKNVCLLPGTIVLTIP